MKRKKGEEEGKIKWKPKEGKKKKKQVKRGG